MGFYFLCCESLLLIRNEPLRPRVLSNLILTGELVGIPSFVGLGGLLWNNEGYTSMTLFFFFAGGGGGGGFG